MSSPLPAGFLCEFNTFVQEWQAQLTKEAIQLSLKYGVETDRVIYILAVGVALGLRSHLEPLTPSAEALLIDGFNYGMQSPLPPKGRGVSNN